VKQARKKPKDPAYKIQIGKEKIYVYETSNRIYRLNAKTGAKELKGVHPQFTLVYREGNRRIKRKFTTLEVAKTEADVIHNRLANTQTEVLNLTLLQKAEYVQAVNTLKQWNTAVSLQLAVADYVDAVKRLPIGISLKEAVDSHLKRHPAGLSVKTVKEVTDLLIKAKQEAGKSDVYVKDLRLRLGHFADRFNVPIASVTASQIEDFLRSARVKKKSGAAQTWSGRTQNNYRQRINTLFEFAIKRGFLPKDHDEIAGVELAEEGHEDIQIFTPTELRKLFGACMKSVNERGKWRNREDMIPYLAIAAFCGLRSAEIARLDWSEVHLNGNEQFIEVKASKAKTASRRTVPIPENCARWLAPFAKQSGNVCPVERPDKQCFQYVGPTAEVLWKRNGLRHSFISYRLAIIKNVHQVSLEAGNSPQMVFAHYRQLVTETHAQEWFGIVPPQDWKNIVPMTEDTAPQAPSAEPANTALAIRNQ
jgi:integrase